MTDRQTDRHFIIIYISQIISTIIEPQGSPSLSTLGFSVSAEAMLGLENGRIKSLSLIVLVLSIQKGPQLTYRPLQLVSQGTPIAGQIMDIDHSSRTSVVSRLSGPGQVGEI